MFPPGHVGIAMAVYAPVGLYLLLRGRPRLAVVGTVVVAGATLLPDVDTALPWFVHRGRTHTVWFALAVGASLGAVSVLVGGYRRRAWDDVLGFGAFGFVVGALAVLAHLVGDVLTPMGVRPLYPLAGDSYTFGLVLASDPAANARLFTLGCLASVAQFALGVGFAPGSHGRAAFRKTSRRFVGAVWGEARGVSDGKQRPVVPEPSTAHVDPGGRAELSNGGVDGDD